MRSHSIVTVFCMSIIAAIIEAQKLNVAKPIVKLDFKSISSKYKLPEERRKLALFPKSVKKFVITEKPIEKRGFSTTKPEVSTKKSLLPKLKLTLKNIDETTYYYRRPVTRPPLMKSKKFTIETITSQPSRAISPPVRNTRPLPFVNVAEQENISESEYDEEDRPDEEPIAVVKPVRVASSTIIQPLPLVKVDEPESSVENQYDEEDHIYEDISSEEAAGVAENNIDNDSEISREITEEYEFTTEIEPYQLPEMENNSLKSDKSDDNTVFSSQSFESTIEEKDASNEFILIKILTSAPVETENKGSAEDNTLTTESSDAVDITKSKRSINIIEEEYQGTTVSGFKFTGRENRLLDHLAFKNINS